MKKIYTVLVALGLALGANAQLNTNLVAHYPFNNSLNDLSGNNYHLSGNGHLFTYDRSGTINECMYFDSTATSGRDSVTGITQLNDQEMTISFWIKPDSNYWNSPKLLNTGYSIANAKFTWSFELKNGFSSDTSGGSLKGTRSADSTSINFYAYHTNFTNYSSAVLGVPNNSWSFVTVTFKANDSIRMYINGTKNQSVYATRAFPFSALAGVPDMLSFGSLNPSYFNQLTKLDEYRIYNKQATDAEVQQLYLSYPLGMSQAMERDQIKIYPNPALNTISFSLDHLANQATATIYAMDGKLISNQSIQNIKTDINVSRLASGLYVMLIQNGEQILTSKFTKR